MAVGEQTKIDWTASVQQAIGIPDPVIRNTHARSLQAGLDGMPYSDRWTDSKSFFFGLRTGWYSWSELYEQLREARQDALAPNAGNESIERPTFTNFVRENGFLAALAYPFFVFENDLAPSGVKPLAAGVEASAAEMREVGAKAGLDTLTRAAAPQSGRDATTKPPVELPDFRWGVAGVVAILLLYVIARGR